jgi:TonB-dependent SusC/RagA subfamily outer membrane receptor
MKTKFSGILTLILAFVVQFSFAQDKTVTGVVTDNSGLPLPGVTIIVKGTSNGTQTDFDGNYSINASETSTLVYSFIGFKTQEQLVGSKTNINVTLAESTAELDEVVVVAFGQQNKRKLIQSVSVVDEEALRDIPANSPQELIQGQAAGVQVVQSSGVLGAAPTIKIRGVASVSSGARPLFVVDGVPLNDTDLTSNQGANQGLNPLANINPNDIASISVLKDASATAVYGSRGSNGCINYN